MERIKRIRNLRQISIVIPVPDFDAEICWKIHAWQFCDEVVVNVELYVPEYVTGTLIQGDVYVILMLSFCRVVVK